MMKKIKRKFLALSLSALFVLLAVIVAGMNVINYNSVMADVDETLTLLSKNKGAFPDFNGGDMPKHMTLETPYASRYFSVLLGESGDLVQTDTSRIKAVDTESAIQYAAAATATGREQGFIGSYRFLCCSEGNFLRIIFLDCSTELSSFRTFLVTSCCMAAAGFLLVFAVLLFFSERIIQPVTESYEKQRRFITDAGHEIKTPLAIIQADVDVLVMELGESEWLEDIQKQARRLADLTNDLVYLSHMEEEENAMQMIEFPFSDVVSETASSFLALAQTQRKDFQCHVQPMLSLVGNEKAIRQLVNVLMDNALKYSPEGGIVSLTVQKQGRQIRLSVFNTTEMPVPREKLNQIFDRFYRIDSSRSTQTGGYGIGLSVAKAIVASHGGKIFAATKDGQSLEITAQFQT